MKFLINKKYLIESIKISNQIIDNNNSSPYIQGMYINVSDDKVSFMTTNGFVSCKAEIKDNIKIIQPGDILIKSRLLFSIINKLKNEDILFEKVDNSVLKIKTESFDSNINIMDEEQYPTINFNYNNWQEIELSPIIFKSIITKIIHSISTNKEKVTILNGVFFNGKNKILTITGSDSFRLSHLVYKYDGPDFKIVIDGSILSLLSEIIQFDNSVKLYLSDNSVIIKIKNFIFSTKIMDGQYPDISGIINSPRDNFAIVNKRELIDALERGIVLAMAEKKPIAKIEIKKDLINVSFRSVELGNSEERIKVLDFYGNEIVFSLNATFLLSLLKVVDSDKVKISTSTDNKPIILTDENDKNFIQLLLPIRNIY